MIRGELAHTPRIRERSYRGENPGPARMIRGELDPRPGIREQPGSMAAVRPLEGLVRLLPSFATEPRAKRPLKESGWRTEYEALRHIRNIDSTNPSPQFDYCASAALVAVL